MLSKKEMLILSHLRENSRKTLKQISKESSIPISTVYDNVKKLEKGMIKRYVTMLDYGALGYKFKTMLFITSKNNQELLKFLMSNENVNNLKRVLNNSNFYVEAVFSTLMEVFDFKDRMMSLGVEKIEEYYVVDEIKVEEFEISGR